MSGLSRRANGSTRNGFTIGLPDLATAREQGLTDFDIPSWYALFLPAGTLPAIVEKLNRATVAALENPAIQDRLKQIGGDVVAPERRSPDYLAQFLPPRSRH